MQYEGCGPSVASQYRWERGKLYRRELSWLTGSFTMVCIFENDVRLLAALLLRRHFGRKHLSVTVERDLQAQPRAYGSSITNRQVPSGWRRTISVALCCIVNEEPSAVFPDMFQSL